MCIRDRHNEIVAPYIARYGTEAQKARFLPAMASGQMIGACLLYTSDAADERSSVDLGGRRIIKKKKARKSLVAVRIKNKTMANRQPTEKSI